MPIRLAERRLRLVGDGERPRNPKDPMTALTACATFLDQQAEAVDDHDVAEFLRLAPANARLEAFIRHAGDRMSPAPSTPTSTIRRA